MSGEANFFEKLFIYNRNGKLEGLAAYWGYLVTPKIYQVSSKYVTDDEGELVESDDDSESSKSLQRLTFLWLGLLLLTVAFGVYLATWVAPLILSALSGLVAPWLAIPLAILASMGLVFGTAALLMPFSSLHKLFVLETAATHYFETHSDKMSNGHKIFNGLILPVGYFITVMVGLGLGIYLSTLLIPLVINALALAAVPHAFAVFIGIATSLLLINMTIDVIAVVPQAITTIRNTLRMVFQIMGTNERLLNALYLGLGLAGMVAGVYACTFVAPLLISTLTALAISQGIAMFTAIAVSVALVGLTTRLAATLGVWLGLALRISYDLPTLLNDKNTTGYEPAETFLKKTSPTIFTAAVFPELLPSLDDPEKTSDSYYGVPQSMP